METIHQHNCDAQMTPLLSETRNGVHFLVLQYALHQTRVPALYSLGDHLTTGTGSRWGSGMHRDYHVVGFADLLNSEVIFLKPQHGRNIVYYQERRFCMKRRNDTQEVIGITLALLGGTTIIIGVFLPELITSWNWNGHSYDGIQVLSELAVMNPLVGSPLLSLFLDVVIGVSPLLFIFSVLVSLLSRKASSRRIVIGRRIAAPLGLLTHAGLGYAGLMLGGISSHMEFGAGFYVVFIGFIVLTVSAFLS